MRKFVVGFMIAATLAVTVFMLFSIWNGMQDNLKLFGKALISYAVISISFYLTTRYIDILDRSEDKKDK